MLRRVIPSVSEGSGGRIGALHNRQVPRYARNDGRKVL